jgi:uncharacterized membrane protein YhiD involved in acid resistance
MNWHHFVDLIRGEMASGIVSSSIVRVLMAAILGGLIGLEREWKHRAAGLRTNMFICFGAAMFTLLSERLAGVPSDAARIAAQIIPGIGFIGAGSIIHNRGLTTGLTSAATIFVVASIGMAAGGGLYLTAIFATGLVLLSLYLLGQIEETFNLKLLTSSYEVTGAVIVIRSCCSTSSKRRQSLAASLLSDGWNASDSRRAHDCFRESHCLWQ